MYIFQVLQEVSATVITAVIHSFRNVYHSAAICAFMSNDALQVPRMGMRHTPPPIAGPQGASTRGHACVARGGAAAQPPGWCASDRPHCANHCFMQKLAGQLIGGHILELSDAPQEGHCHVSKIFLSHGVADGGLVVAPLTGCRCHSPLLF